MLDLPVSDAIRREANVPKARNHHPAGITNTTPKSETFTIVARLLWDGQALLNGLVWD